MNLVEHGYRRALSEIARSRARGFVAVLAFHGKDGLSVFDYNEVDLATVGITQIAQLHAMTFDVFLPMAELQQLRCNEVLESRPRFRHGRPVPEIKLLRLLEGADAFGPERRDAEADVEIFEDRDPTLGCFVIHFEVFPEALDGQRRADLLRQEVRQLLHQRYLSDPFKIPQVLTDDTRHSFSLPQSQLAFILTEQRLGKAAELEQHGKQLLFRFTRGDG